MFDYMFYTLFIIYEKKDKKTAFSQAFKMFLVTEHILVSYIMILSRYFFFNSIEYTVNQEYYIYAICIIGGLINIYLHKSYFKKNYNKIVSKYKKHPFNGKIKFWMFVVFLYFITVGVPLLVGLISRM